MIAIALLTITVSIGLPIYVRPFYYVQVVLLDLPERTGESAATIRQAYDEVLDYLTLPGKEFGTGVFQFSEQGKSHFADCKVLFTLNAVVGIASMVAVILCKILQRKRRITCIQPFGLRPSALSGGVLLGLFSLLGVCVAMDFDRAFELFHRLFFVGKDNWMFDPKQDEIIQALPQEFFLNCAVCIGVSVLLISVSLFVSGIVARNQERRCLRETHRADSGPQP